MEANFALIPELPSDARSSHPVKPSLRSADEVKRAWRGGDLNLQAGMDVIATGTLMETWLFLHAVLIASTPLNWEASALYLPVDP
eukprot:338752-Pelagomonas_calceolata.AAC.3